MTNSVSKPPTMRVLIVGGPDAGKTNYIGRLWLATEDGKSALSRNGLPSDLSYLSGVYDSILKGSFAPRTSIDQPATIEIPFRITGDSQNIGCLEIPDCRGETWLTISKMREWPSGWDAYIEDMCACLLFVRIASPSFQPSLDWVTVESLFRGLPCNSPTQTPTQVHLVDWLQIITSRIDVRKKTDIKVRIGIVITAWDRVPSEQSTIDPREYLRANYPLLDQYIDACSERYEVEVFGVSSFGGDFENQPGYSNEFLTTGPQKCGYTVYMNSRGFTKREDVTLPVAWCLGFQLL